MRDWSRIGESYEVIGSFRGAAFVASILCTLQSSPCDIATYYDAQLIFPEGWCGLFSRARPGQHAQSGAVEVKKPYYAFRAFAELARLGTQTAAQMNEEGSIHVCAAAGEAGQAVLLANFSDDDCRAERIRVHLKNGGNAYAVYKLDKTHNLEWCGEIADGDLLSMGRCSVVLLKSE